jgi:hypothetical protein
MLVACGDDPAGPEELSLEMVAPVAVGGALLELSGENILEVRGPAGVEITTLPIRAEGEKALPRLRVLAILETPGPLNLTVVVAEAGAPVPGATLLQASGPDDALLLSSRLPAIRVVR